MPRSGEATKEKILDATEALVYQHGFAATSLDNVLETAGLTKGGFFYHFKNKADLGRALIERYAARDEAMLENTMRRAENISDDPLQQVLIFVGLLKEPIEEMTEPAPGCLFASYCYQPKEFVPEIAEVASETLLKWRRRLEEKFVAISEKHSTNPAVHSDSLADHLLAVIEGSYVLSKVFKDPGLPARQLEHYRRYLENLFTFRNSI